MGRRGPPGTRLQPPPSLGPTRSTLATRPASTPALASAFPDAFEFFRPPKYLEPCPSPREDPGNTKTGHLLAWGRPPAEGGEFLGLLFGRRWGLSVRGSRQGYGSMHNSLGEQPFLGSRPESVIEDEGF
jgi:hypothetical protein